MSAKIAARITEEQRRQWATDGYIVIKNALLPEDITALCEEVDRLYNEHLLKNPEADVRREFSRRPVVEDSSVFLKMMDYKSIFGLVLDLLGPCIQLSMSQALIRPANTEYYGFVHTDGGQAMQRIRVSETSLPLQLKVQYFLTDVREPNGGNFVVFPGSHLRPYPVNGPYPTPDSPGVVQLCVSAGDAVLFSHALWHGVMTNRSSQSRKSLIYGYNQLFFRPYDYVQPSEKLLSMCTPRQRRLLGDIGNWKQGSFHYAPEDQVWLMEEL